MGYIIHLVCIILYIKYIFAYNCIKSIIFIIAIFENLLEFRPELCTDAGKQGLMQWLLRRIKAKMPFDANKLYASELLSILVQNTPENRLLLGDLDGIDVLLQQLAVSSISSIIYVCRLY